jgi:hypothetical protein
LARARLTTFWSFCFCTAMAFPKTSFRSWKPPRFSLFYH